MVTNRKVYIVLNFRRGMERPKQFDGKKNLTEFLEGGDEGISRNIVGKSLIHRHCGNRMIKIQEFKHDVKEDGRLNLDKLNGKLFYCFQCGYDTNTYPLFCL